MKMKIPFYLSVFYKKHSIDEIENVTRFFLARNKII